MCNTNLHYNKLLTKLDITTGRRVVLIVVNALYKSPLLLAHDKLHCVKMVAVQTREQEGNEVDCGKVAASVCGVHFNERPVMSMKKTN